MTVGRVENLKGSKGREVEELVLCTQLQHRPCKMTPFSHFFLFLGPTSIFIPLPLCPTLEHTHILSLFPGFLLHLEAFSLQRSSSSPTSHLLLLLAAAEFLPLYWLRKKIILGILQYETYHLSCYKTWCRVSHCQNWIGFSGIQSMYVVHWTNIRDNEKQTVA